MITILLAEDHTLVRQGLKALLQSESDFKVVGEAADGLSAVQEIDKTNPQVVLLDLMIPRLHGLEVLRQLRSRRNTNTIVLTMHAEEPYVLEALRLGARGYVLKDALPSDLVSAIRKVSQGDFYLSPQIKGCAVSAYLTRSKGKAKTNSGELTMRERLVLELVAQGKPNHEIAERLFISKRTVDSHRANIMRKLGCRSQIELVRYAIRNHIVSA